MSERGPGEARLTVFLVDDHRLFRSGVRAELSETVDVIGEAEDVASAVAGIASAHGRAAVFSDRASPGQQVRG